MEDRQRIAMAMRQTEDLTRILWEIYELTGAGTDGDTGPGALINGMGVRRYAEMVRDAVRELRQERDAVSKSANGAEGWARQSRTRLAWLLESGLAACSPESLRAQVDIILAEQVAALAVLANPDADERHQAHTGSG